MAEITAQLVKELRERTGAGMMECKSALKEAGGDIAEAEVVLRKRGIASAGKKSARATRQGLIGSYIHHGGQLGVMVEINCESDFVARTDDFQELVHDIAMHIAAADPQFIRKEDVTEAALEKERDIQRARALNEGKPEKMVDKIVEGRMAKYFEEVCLLEQPFVKEASISVGSLIKTKIAKLGENITVARFVRFKVGDVAAAESGGIPPRATVPRFNRILLKLSGESLAGGGAFGINAERVRELAGEVAEVAAAGVQTGIVVGGGNIFRGVAAAAQKMDRVTGDHMGMLATVINALAFSDALEQMGVPTRVMSAIEMHQVCEPYIRRRAIRHLEKGRIVIFAAGTSNPYFSTDTAATLRALEIRADVIAKATRVDGVYDKDPLKFPDAVMYKEISYLEVLSKALGVMDATSIAMCRDNKLPILVFNLNAKGNIMRMSMGEPVGTLIH